MPGWLDALLAALGGLVVLWAALVIALAMQARRHGVALTAGQAVRLGPDVVRLVVRLVRDRDVPRRTRVVLGVLALYLLSPVDLVPDFIPVLGYADDALVAALAVRVAMRGAGRSLLERNWPGTPEGLAAVLALTGQAPSSSDPGRRSDARVARRRCRGSARRS